MRHEQIDIEITTAGPAFRRSPASEIAAVLRELARQFEEDGGPTGTTLTDSQGQPCGSCTVRPR